MKPSKFEIRFNGLKYDINDLPHYGNDDVASFLAGNRYEEAVELLDTAYVKNQAGEAEAAWFALVKAAQVIGYLSGLNEISELNTPEQGVIELLRERGRTGGNKKGQNWELKRDQAARALIAAAPNGKWPSRTAFEMKYHSIVQTVPGFSDTEHQRRKIMSRADIKATLPVSPKRAAAKN